MRRDFEDSKYSTLKNVPIAVKKLTEAYDVNFGARSVMHEVQRIAVQFIADAYIRGDLQKGCVKSLLLICCVLNELNLFKISLCSWHAYLTIDELEDVILQSANPLETVKIRRGCHFHHM